MKRKRVFSILQAAVLAVLLLFVNACSEHEDSEETLGDVNFTIDISSPNMESILLASLADGKSIDTDFYSHFKDNSKPDVLIRQNGKTINIGEFPTERISDSMSEHRITVDVSGKVVANKPYDIYIMGCGWRYDENGIYYKNNMSRGGSFGNWLKFSSSSKMSKATANIAGTGEILFVINKSNSPIKFKHKGFDAEKKWYYKSAEVSIDNDKVVKSEDGEIESDIINISVFTGQNAYGIYSIYVPNGNKIQDAQLIAEINGKEIRSENRISSDITLQTNHSYAMFAIWDGEKLTLGDNGPSVIDLSNPEKSEIRVVSLDDNGTITIEATEERAPKVGDYLCSGPTDIAPYGYMLRVTEVQKAGNSATRSTIDDLKRWVWIIKTTAAAINEVLGNISLSYHIPFEDIDIDQVTDNEGNSIEFKENAGKEWVIPIKNLNLGKNISISPEIKIRPKELVFYLETKDKEFKKFGADFKMEVDASIQVDAKLEAPFSKTINLFWIILKPHPVWFEPPIVVTPLFQVYLTFEANGKVTLSCIPVKSTYEISGGGYYDFQQEKMMPSIGNDFVKAENKSTNLGEMSKMEKGFCFDGSVSAQIGASYSVGIDGCNYIGRVDFLSKKLDFLADMLSAEFWCDVTRKVTAKLGVDDIDMEETGDFHFYDGCKVENYFQAHLQFNLRVWNPFKQKFIGYDPKFDGKEFHFWEDDLYPSFFVPDYGKFTISIKDGNVILQAYKYKPYFGNTLFKEKVYGFRYGKFIKDKKITDWKAVPPKNVIGNADDPLWHIDAVIPLSELEKGVTYFVCPYSYGMLATGDYNYLHRKGLYIRVNNNGKLTYHELPDIPGTNL